MKFGRDLSIIVPNEYRFARICICCGDQDMFKMVVCSHFELYCFFIKSAMFIIKKLNSGYTFIMRSAIGVLLCRSEIQTIPKMFKMASSSDLFLLFKLTQNVMMKKLNLTQRFTEEANISTRICNWHISKIFEMSSGRHLEYFQLLFFHVSWYYKMEIVI